jgi:hypothetical protein
MGWGLGRRYGQFRGVQRVRVGLFFSQKGIERDPNLFSSKEKKILAFWVI